MAGKQAKTLSDRNIHALLNHTKKTRKPLRNRAIVLLSVKAGLRAGEIAKLTWDMVLDANGRVSDIISVEDAIAKKRGGRRIPLHPELKKALTMLLKDSSGAGAVICSERQGPMTSVSIVNWFAIAYRAIGLEGCSSHSGRRTFVTRAAKAVHRAGGSLRDVQLLAGHKSIQVTERYIDGDSRVQHKLVSMI